MGRGAVLEALFRAFRGVKGDAKQRLLSFPNPSRTYDGLRHGIVFWGYDRTFEISFCVEEAALSKIDPATHPNEAGFLDTFDVNCARIQEAASRVYTQHPNDSWTFDYVVTAVDL